MHTIICYIHKLSLKLGMTLSTSFSFASVMLLPWVMWVASFNMELAAVKLRSAHSGFPSLASEVGSCELGHLAPAFLQGWLETWYFHISSTEADMFFGWFGLKICEDMLALLVDLWLILHTVCFNFPDRESFQDSNNFQGSALLVLVSLGRHPVPLVYTCIRNWSAEAGLSPSD